MANRRTLTPPPLSLTTTDPNSLTFDLQPPNHSPVRRARIRLTEDELQPTKVTFKTIGEFFPPCKQKQPPPPTAAAATAHG